MLQLTDYASSPSPPRAILDVDGDKGTANTNVAIDSSLFDLNRYRVE
jgi:hypothetical protein